MAVNAKVLLIDDSDSFLELTAAVLSRRGHAVCCAQDGKAGIELAEAEQPDLILLDVHMPGLDGIGVLSQLRRRASTSSIPVLMLSGSGSEQHFRIAIGLGAHGYILKPFNIRDLLGRIEAVLAPPASNGS